MPRPKPLDRMTDAELRKAFSEARVEATHALKILHGERLAAVLEHCAQVEDEMRQRRLLNPGKGRKEDE